jgi:hypothetical protein
LEEQEGVDMPHGHHYIDLTTQLKMVELHVDGKQITLCWHVDDMKVSHFEKKKVDDMIKWLRLKYEHLFEDGSGAMQICRGKVQEYIGMTLDFTEPGECSVPRLQYVKDTVNDFT